MKIKIEKGIPIPPKQPGVIASLVRTMHVDDSFLVDSSCAVKLAYDAAVRMKRKITTRKIDGQGFRVWRVK